MRRTIYRRPEPEPEPEPVRGAQFKAGFAVSGCPIASLNTQFTQRGEFKGFPLYRAAEGGQAGLYYDKQDSSWNFLSQFTTEGATGHKSVCWIAARAVDGGVPLGEQTWQSGNAERWQAWVVKVVPLHVMDRRNADAVYEWFDDHGAWNPYPANVQAKLQAAYRRGLGTGVCETVEFRLANGFQYRVD
eukprot:COSAG01_NODE_17116_length_1177_cov_2.128015_1_plen_187_part_10